MGRSFAYAQDDTHFATPPFFSTGSPCRRPPYKSRRGVCKIKSPTDGETPYFGDPYGTPRLRAGRGTALTCPRQVIHSRALRVPKGVYKIRSPTNGGTPYFGDPYGTRTHVTAVKGRCLNHLTNGPYKKRSKRCALFGSGTWIRTGDTSGMNRMLWPTELCRHCYVNSIRNIPDLTRLVNTKH